MSDQMDGLLRRAEGLRRFASRGVPFEPLVRAGVDAAIGWGFRWNAQTSLKALLDRASRTL